MYILLFLLNSVAYVLVDTLKGKMVRNDTLSDELYLSFLVVAVLSVVSLVTDKVGVIVKPIRKISKVYSTTVLIVIIAFFMLIDLCLLLVMSDLIDGLHMNLLDRFSLAGLCQIVPIGLLKDPEKN